ncbi:MAG: DNA polymerase III subunit [Phycisphaerales bacterium]|nr:MAG: DNA polymerase III subunit [Phycisphaerales bacterium]
MSLKDVFCQDKAISLLQRAYAAQRMSHAYIFAGPEGVGKFKVAGELARLLLCESPELEKTCGGDFADSCGRCNSCRLFDAGSHPDFNHVYKELRKFTRDGKGKPPPVDLPIDVVREFLIEKAPMRPTLSKRKVFVVSEAERLNASSQNCLLKVLEEPPEYCCIILLCTRLDRLLATTRSRCQTIRFSTIDDDRIIAHLKEMDLDGTKAGYFALLAQGSLGRACEWARLELAGAELYRTKKELIGSIADCRLGGVTELAEKLVGESARIASVWTDLDESTSRSDIVRRSQRTLIEMVISGFHDAMTLNITPEKGAVNFEQAGEIKKLARRFDPESAAERIADCYRMQGWIEVGVNGKLIFEQLLLNIADSGKLQV